MIDVALSCIKSGWHVFPCWPSAKNPITKHGEKDATDDEAQVRAWWTKTPDANVAIACGPSGLCVVDCDHGLTNAEDFRLWRLAKGLPDTYTVRTGRRDSYGVQMYYSGEGLKSIGWEDVEDPKLSGDIRCRTGYVMAAGCLHPNGEKYEAVLDVPLVPYPNYVLEVREVTAAGNAGGTNPQFQDDGGPIDHHRNVRMISLLGRRRAEGADDDALREYAQETNEARMVPPLGEEELERLICNASKFPVPAPEPEILIGGKIAGAAEQVDPCAWRKFFHTRDEMENAPPISFLIEGFLQCEGVTAIAAPVRERKSMIALNMAHALVTGEKLFGQFVVLKKPARVLYLVPEVSLGPWTDRLKRIGLMEYVSTARAAFAVRPTSPMQISVDGADGSIGPGFLQTLFAHPQHGVFEFVLRGGFRW